jgi:hypothetical protein
MSTNSQQVQNDHQSKKLNETTAPIPDKSIIVENTPTIPNTTHQSVEKHIDDSTKEPTIPGKTNR